MKEGARAQQASVLGNSAAAPVWPLAGIPLGIVTAGDRKVVAGQLRRTGVADLIGAAVYGDDSVEQKPDPAPLRRGLAALGRHGILREPRFLSVRLERIGTMHDEDVVAGVHVTDAESAPAVALITMGAVTVSQIQSLAAVTRAYTPG